MKSLRICATFTQLAAVLLAGILTAGSQDDLQQQFRAALDQRDWPQVIELGKKLEARTRGIGVAYNLACAHAQLGDLEASVQWLATAAERGFQGLSLLQTDPDLDPIRGLPGFAKTEEVVRANRQVGFEEFRRLAEKAEPRIIRPKRKPMRIPPLVILALHGYGGTGEGMVQLWGETSEKAGAILVAPDALRRVAGAGFSWTFRDETEWLVLETVRKVREQFGDDSRIVLTGYSQGANSALAIGLKHPGAFAGVVAISGHYERWMLPPAGTPRTPRLFLLIGDRDPWVDTFRQAAADLESRGMDVRLQFFSGAHEWPQSPDKDLRRALKFLRVR